MKILFLSQVLPYPPDAGPKVKSWHVLRFLIAKYILAVGSADPRKNTKTLIRAYALLPQSLRQRYMLVIVWNDKLLVPESFLEAQ